MNSTTELAQRLVSADPGGWTTDGLRTMAATLGWTWPWTGGAAGPVLGTGLPTGDARLTPVGPYEERYTGGEEYVGLVVPLGQPEPGDTGGPAGQAAAADAAVGTVAELHPRRGRSATDRRRTGGHARTAAPSSGTRAAPAHRDPGEADRARLPRRARRSLHPGRAA